MPDVFTESKRSEVMGRIRGKGNKDTEIALIKIMRKHGIHGWRRNQQIFGKPDFVFRDARLAVFVDGCFWHGCPKCYNRPVNNRDFWDEKKIKNKKRDQKVNKTLKSLGWRVLRIWEHELKHDNKVAAKVVKALETDQGNLQN
jgi:DNA mismatch endonuclease (patch repair protein)